jgi:hypothetical protein
MRDGPTVARVALMMIARRGSPRKSLRKDLRPASPPGFFVCRQGRDSGPWMCFRRRPRPDMGRPADACTASLLAYKHDTDAINFNEINDVSYAICAVTRRRFPVGASPTRQTAPAGSNRSSYGGDEIAAAFGMRVTNW